MDSILDAFGKRERLGDVLLRNGTITRQQLEQALAVQKKGRRPLGQTLIDLGYVDDAGMRHALAMQLGIPFLALDRMTVDRSLSRFINRNYARRHTVVPVAVAGQMLTICMDDPTQRGVVEELTRSTGKVITVVTASHESIGRALLRLYEERVETRPTETLELLSEEQQAPSKSKYAIESALTQVDVLVRQLMSAAISRRVSDIHLEMLSDRLQIRFRVDGVLEYLEPGELHDSCSRSAREVISRPSEADIVLINKSATIEDIRASARKSTLSMAESAWLLLRNGQTNLEELVRMMPYDAVVDFRQQALWKAKRLSVAV